MTNWLDSIKEVLKNKSENFSEQEKENISFNNLIAKIEGKFIIDNEELTSKIEYVITEIPCKTEGKRINYQTKHLN